jgi:lysophospholipase L1-like esterase
MRILVVGDSLALHRAPAGQSLDQTWPWQLKLLFRDADVWVRSEPGALVNRVLEQLACFEGSLELFDLVIVQAGINDACPRPMPYALHRLFGWFGHRGLQKAIRRNYARLLKLYSRPWTSETNYRTQLCRIVATVRDASPSTRVLVVPMPRPCKNLVKKIPGSPAAVERYNRIIDEVVTESGSDTVAALAAFVDDCSDEFILADGHHLTAGGHRLLAEHISRFILGRVRGLRQEEVGGRSAPGLLAAPRGHRAPAGSGAGQLAA